METPCSIRRSSQTGQTLGALESAKPDSRKRARDDGNGTTNRPARLNSRTTANELSVASGRSTCCGTSSATSTTSWRPPRRTTPGSSACWKPAKAEILAAEERPGPGGPAALQLRHHPAAQPKRAAHARATAAQAATEESVDIFNAGRKMRVGISPLVNMNQLARRARRSCSTRRSWWWPALGYERAGELVTLKEMLGTDRALVVGPRGRGAGHPALRGPAGPEAAGRRRPLHRLPHRLRAGEDSALRGGEPGPRRSPGHHLPGHRRTGPADRTDPRRRRTAVPAPGPVPRARAEGAQGHPALRPSGLRQDADRQGRGQLAGGQGRRTRRQDGHEELLPEHQGPGTAGQVRRRDRTPHPADLRPGPGEGVRGQPRRGVLRRDGFAVPDPRHRHLLRRRDHHRAAAAQRDRRRGAAGQRDRDRRLQPRGHDRPGHPAPGPAGREGQDPAPGRRGGRGHLQQVHHHRPALPRSRTSPSTAGTSRPPWTR